ncbi:signaling mucin MSB2-like [Pyrus communis]|uniref:signaling mucin MSB2-like n=1 Tax=Pyrus communis TaxID=23211 RepID=UPI0035BED11D
MLLFLLFLHGEFPFVFSLLVYAFPVFVCSVVLLGTLLIFGQSDIPKTEKEQKISRAIASLRTQVSREDIFVETEASFPTGRRSRKSRDTAESSEVDDYEGSVGYMPLINESLQNILSGKRLTEVGRELDSKELESRRNVEKEKARHEGMTREVRIDEKRHSLVQKVGDENRDSVNAHKGDHYLELSGGDVDANDDEASDYGLEKAESSSPDGSIADIFPILDELCPLLDLEAPQLADDESDSKSDRSNNGSNESNEDIRNKGGEVEDDGVDDNDGDEEEAHGGKEDEFAIKWTDDDQKNLMDLGNLELERNQRLETIVRRRAMKSFSLPAEKNLIDLDSSENPFNVTPISTTRHNPFDPQYDSSYDNMGLPPIPGSAPSILLPRKNPFHFPYELNENKPDHAKGDHFQQYFMTSQPKEAFFHRHESFNLGPLSIRDAKQERQEFKWRPFFVLEQLAPEGANCSSLQRQSSGASDLKLSSSYDTESVSSAANMDDRKFSEQDFAKEVEVISNIYQSYDLVGHGSQSSEDVDYLEIMEHDEKMTVQHGELEIKLGKVENSKPSLLGTGGYATHMEMNDELSLSSLSKVDEKISDGRKGGSSSSKSRSDLVMKVTVSPQPPLGDSEVHFTSGMVDDNQHKEPIYDPIYDSSPSASENALSFDSISSDIRADISKLISNSNSDTNRFKNLDENEASSNSSYQYVSSKENPPLEQEKHLSWSDKSMVEPHFDDHKPLTEPASILLVSKEDSSTIQDVKIREVNDVQDPSLTDLSSVPSKSALSNIESGVQEPTTTYTASKQVCEVNVGELPKPFDSNDGLTKVETNDMGSTKEIASRNMRSSAQENLTTQSSLKLVSMGNVSELPKQSNANDAVGSKKETASRYIGSGVQEAVTTKSSLKMVSVGNVSELPKQSNANDAVGFKNETTSSYTGFGAQEVVTTNSASKKISEGNVDELPKSPNSKNRSEKMEINAMESTKQISSNNTRSSVQETTIDIAMKPVSERNAGNITEPSNAKDGFAEVRTNIVGFTKEVASSNIGSGVQETITTHMTLKQVSEGNVGELRKPSDSEDGSTKVGTNAVRSTKEVASNNTRSGVQETMITHTGLKQVSEGNASGLSKSSNSKDEPKKRGINVINSIKEVVSTNSECGDHKAITTNTGSKQVPEGNVGELPKELDLKNGLTKIETIVASSSKELASSNAELGVQEPITAHSLKQVSKANVGELLKPSTSKDGPDKVKTNALGSTKEISSTNTRSSNAEPITTNTALKQVLDGSVGKLPKALDLKDGSTKLGANALGSTKEITLSNPDFGIQETITIDTFLKQVSEGKVGELPKQSDLNDELTKVESNVVGSAKDIASNNTKVGVQDTIIIRTSVNQVSENVSEIPKPPISKDESAKVGTNAAGSTKGVTSSNAGPGVQEFIATHMALKQILEGNIGKLTKLSEDGYEKLGIDVVSQTITTYTASKQVSEKNIVELSKPLDSKDGSTKVGTNAMSSNPETKSSNSRSVPETITTDAALKQVSEGNIHELLKPLNANDGLTEVETNVAGSSKEIESSNTKSGVLDVIWKTRFW